MTTTTQPDIQISSTPGAQIAFKIYPPFAYRIETLIHIHYLRAESLESLERVLDRLPTGRMIVEVPDTEEDLHCWLRQLHWHCKCIEWGENGERDRYVFERVVR